MLKKAGSFLNPAFHLKKYFYFLINILTSVQVLNISIETDYLISTFAFRTARPG